MTQGNGKTAFVFSGGRQPRRHSDLVTSRMLGCFRDNQELRRELLQMTAWRRTEAIMADPQNSPTGPDLTQGVALSDFVNGHLLMVDGGLTAAV